MASEIATVEEEGAETSEKHEAAEDNVRFATHRAGQASTWQHISKHKIRDTTIVLPGIKTIT